MAARSKFALGLISVLFRAGAAVVLLAIAIAVFVVLKSTKVEPERIVPEASAVLVRTIDAPQRDIASVYEGYGTARAMDAAVISAQVAGRVDERPDSVEPGNEIDEGGIIVRLESADFASRAESSRQRINATEAQLDALDAESVRVERQVRLAREELEIDQRDLDRIRKAAEEGSGTEADIDQRIMTARRSERTLESLLQTQDLIAPRRHQLEAELANLQSALEVDEQDLLRTTVRSPIAGQIQSCGVEVGEYLRVGDQIARVVNLDRVEVPLKLPVSASGSVQRGDAVSLRGDGAELGSWRGVVTRIAPETDAASRTMTVFVEVEQPEPTGRLLPGQFVTGSVTASETSSRVLVPRRAVSGDRVLLARGNSPYRVEPVDVEISHYIELELPEVERGERQWAVLAGGVEPGELVIVSNLDSLVGGMLVEPTAMGAEGGE